MTSVPMYGRFQVPEAPSAMRSLHFHRGRKLVEVDHEPPLGVLDQSDLIAQGIDTSALIKGAKNLDGLGSCTANATTAALSKLLPEAEFLKVTGAASYADVKTAEEWAIGFYHACTDQTGDPSQEWPPTDCGSSGPYIVSELQAQKLAGGAQIAHGAENLISLLQDGPILTGSPFLNAWEDPDVGGFIDGDGSYEVFLQQINGGVAGGHETVITAVEKLVLTVTGKVDADKTILRHRNSWSASWGDHGDFRSHLSTWVTLGSYCDFRLLTV
jgi:hypothetical protein